MKLSTAGGDRFQSRIFLSSLLLHALYEGDSSSARNYLEQLERLDIEKKFEFERTLGHAVIAAFTNATNDAERKFRELATLQSHSNYLAPYWKGMIAERKGDWQEMLEHASALQTLAKAENFRVDLPGIYLNLAKAHLALGNSSKALDFAKQSTSIIDESRQIENTPLALGTLETYHTAYRLLAQLRTAEPQLSLEISDQLKARVLRDRIDNSALRARPNILPEIRHKIDQLVSKFVAGADTTAELLKLEKEATNSTKLAGSLETVKGDFTKTDGLNSSAIVSYLFKTDGKLLAYVCLKGKPVRVVELEATEHSTDALAIEVNRKIKDFIFFKKDGKELYDKFIAPLSITADHLIIIPDKSLWKIPFPALSPDGRSYLVEKKRVSYAPSVATVIDSLRRPAPNRRTIKVFANNLYHSRFLRHANPEAMNIAKIFGSRPILNATAYDFLDKSAEADILHFAMHAELDPEEPLDSFLGFRPAGRHDGRMRVEDLLKARLKPGSLAFIASCDTNNVLNGEGLVSIAWALLASGSTTVISSRWAVDDRSTKTFTELFYRFYKAGDSSSEALQKASLEMIHDKSRNFYEPYYWAAFMLNGDFR